jgi:16S rRNA (guanine527-N7)-methyltransferase
VASNGLDLNPEQHDRLVLYIDLLREWNAKVNLVSRKDEEGIWPNHILHSLSLLFEFSFPDGLRIADLGSGGGLPAIPLAIASPNTHIVMIESIRKKCVALEDILNRLSLTNISLVHGRAEEVARNQPLFHSFDVVTARGVAPLDELISWSLLLVRRGRGPALTRRRSVPPAGTATPLLIALKGGELSTEINTARQKHGKRPFHQIPVAFIGMEKTALTDKYIIAAELQPQ